MVTPRTSAPGPRQLCHDGAGTEGGPVHILRSEAKPIRVAEGHVHDRLMQSVLHSPGRPDLAGGAQGVEGVPGLLEAVGGSVLRRRGTRDRPEALNSGGEHVARLARGDGKGDQGGGTSISRKEPDMESLPPMAAIGDPAGRSGGTQQSGRRACPSGWGPPAAFQSTPGT